MLFFGCFLLSKGERISKSTVPRLNQFNIGIDLAQFYYYINDTRKGLNYGLNVNYRPYRFVGFNVSYISNEVNRIRDEKFPYNFVNYRELEAYKSKGNAIKFGFDLSLPITRKEIGHRWFGGYQRLSIGLKSQVLFELRSHIGAIMLDYIV
ncbi:MAG: hypothetical protein R2852_03150 [Bacteroidia bacterium]